MRVKYKDKKLSLFLIKHNAMKTYGRVELKLQAFLTPTLYEDEWSVSHHGNSSQYPFSERPNGPLSPSRRSAGENIS
jgi:hypothetical protein